MQPPTKRNDGGQVLHGDPVQQQGFTQTENVVLRDTRLSVQARFLYTLLKMYAWQADSAYPGQDTLAALMGVKVRMVQIYLKELIDLGLIERKQRGQTKSNVYILQPLGAIYCAPPSSDTQPITCQDTQSITGPDTQPITYEEDAEKKTQDVCATHTEASATVTIPLPVPTIDASWEPAPALTAAVRPGYGGTDAGYRYQVERFRAAYHGRPARAAPNLFRAWMLNADPAKEPAAAPAPGPTAPPVYFDVNRLKGERRL